MARIKIVDLPEDQEISRKELKQFLGGAEILTGLRVQLQETRSKTSTGLSFSGILDEGLSKAADTMMSAGQIAAPYLPGGTTLSASESG